MTDRYHPFVTERKREQDHATTDSKNQIKDGGQKTVSLTDHYHPFVTREKERTRSCQDRQPSELKKEDKKTASSTEREKERARTRTRTRTTIHKRHNQSSNHATTDSKN